MKQYQVKFRVPAYKIPDILSILSKVGPIVIEEVEEVQQITKPEKVISIPPPIVKVRKKPKQKGGPTGPEVVLAALMDGPKAYSELSKVLGTAGFASTGVGSVLGKLRDRGLARSTATGWEKVND